MKYSNICRETGNSLSVNRDIISDAFTLSYGKVVGNSSTP